MAIPVTFVGDKYSKPAGQKVKDKPSASGNPRLIQQKEFKVLQPFNTSTKVQINNIFWMNTPVETGRVFTTSQGSRLVLEANINRVIYILINPKSVDNNKPFIQPRNGFVADVVFYVEEEAGRRLQTVKKIAEYEVQFLIGIFSVTSWGAFALVASVDALEFVVKNKANFPKWNRIIKACLQTRKDLKKFAPVMYDKLVYATLLIAWEGTRYAGANTGEISESLAKAAIEDPKIAGRGSGIIAGKLGANIMNGRISVLAIVWTLMVTSATKLATAVPNVIQSTVNSVKEKNLREMADLANQILSIIRQADIQLTRDEAVIIASEVYAHPKDLLESFKNLAKAFKDD